ncbi:polymer-forming cytoskeletal protein [Lujinxingia vulgaris]|uniref:Polymer-forming cytoskeletal protein n=2 Tax=Lujinxingia TaxID=2653226 RepID=A0A5C6X3W0_9DELT|nr:MULTISPECIES: polymer-forming cytoskeletal protein [Lujinxingia]RDV39660.1 polymer-forming cytoskeletal protein [Bradymonadaceae bacterium TMQ3]RVU48295.1 polymer-forming cytoskeletal protein [Lujinxingia sediminis]TXC77595.1 polymer-forming cytoskeletal protein [Bradymonadales bacterium TMQ1]TXD32700.1 polymer-forming cytoskeletal protein [Lujinxingia vulgaris]
MAPTSCTIGPGVAINGRLSGDDEVVVFGTIEGNVALSSRLTVEEGGKVVADIDVQSIAIRGEVNGEVVAHDVIELLEGCLVTGNLRAPRVIIQEGARFKGNIDMDVQIDG